MTPLFKKLNLKDQTRIVVLNAPDSFMPELDALTDITVQTAVRAGQPIRFALAFVSRQAEVDKVASKLTAAAEGDAILWFAYPKQSSRKYTCDFNRDTGWRVLGEAGFEPVRAVAIDEDWSALRFRRSEHIKSMKRDPSRAVSALGRRPNSKNPDLQE